VKRERQKTNSEFADDVQAFLGDYDVKNVYIDPSAAAFKVEMRKRGIHMVDANNEVLDGITMLTSEMKRGTITICAECKNTIREIETYVWDQKQALKGYDEPLKKDDHAVDALRYAIATHHVSTYDPYKQDQARTGRMVNTFDYNRDIRPTRRTF
jgi:phage terminase large subunit